MLGGGVVLLLRNREAQLAETTHDPCEALKGVSPSAYEACTAALGVGGAVLNILKGTVNYGAADAGGKWDKENIALNGGVEIPLDKTLKQRVMGYSSTSGQLATVFSPLGGSALKYKNGGVPFKGFPGWELCAPGTHDLFNGTAQDVKLQASSGFDDDADYAGKPLVRSLQLTGHPGDAFTFKRLRWPNGRNAPPVLDGYYVGGVQVPVCQGGQVIERNYIREWRNPTTGKREVQYRCAAPGKSYQDVWGGGPGNTLPNGDFGDFGQYTDGAHEQISPTDHPGYHLVPATPLVPAHWERDHA